MKKIAAVLLLAIMMFFPPVTARAGVGIVFPPPSVLATGHTLGVNSGGEDAKNGAVVIYTAPRIFERIKDPLEMRQSSVETYSGWTYSGMLNGHLTLQQLFVESLDDELRKISSSFEVLQIVRVFDSRVWKGAAFWFVFIEKDKLIPLDQLSLPAPTARKKK